MAAALRLSRDRQAGRASTLSGGISTDFRQWLSTSSFSSFDFARDDLSGGSFGGRTTSGELLSRRPVVFVHGNSDRAIGGGFNGWGNSTSYFLDQGYTSAELYATTWGPANQLLASAQYHSKIYLMRTRAFLEAVLAYTGAAQIDVISHSMGVTLSRKAILGGAANDLLDGGRYDLGTPLTASVHTFIGISGANSGLTSCWATGPSTPTCGATNGFYPGQLVWGSVSGRSAFLDDLQAAQSGFEGARRFSMWSRAETVGGYGPLVYGQYTSRFPGQMDEVVSGSEDHLGMKDETAGEQFNLVNSTG